MTATSSYRLLPLIPIHPLRGLYRCISTSNGPYRYVSVEAGATASKQVEAQGQDHWRQPSPLQQTPMGTTLARRSRTPVRTLLRVDGGATMTRRGREASDRLTQALITMASQGLRPNCSDPESHWMWLSEHPAERQLAALMCNGCWVITECGDAAEANGERFGVWSGRDYTRAPGKKLT